MKRIIMLVTALILVVSALAGELLIASPTIATIEPYRATALDGTGWVVENRLYSPCIYTVNGGKVTKHYRTKRLMGDYQAVTSLGTDGELLYYTRQAVDVGGNPKDGWSVWQYDGTTNKARQISEQPGTGMVKGLVTWQETIWVTTQNSEGAAIVYRMPMTGGVPQEVERVWLPEGKHLIQANYTTMGKLTVLLDTGKTVQIVNGILQDSLAAYPYGHGLNEVSLEPMVWFKLRLPGTLAIMVLIVLLVLMPIPLLYLYRRAQKLLNRVWAVGTLGVLVTYVLSVAMLLMQTFGVLGQASLYSSFAVAGQVAALIGRQDIALLPTGGEEEAAARQTLYSLLGAQDELFVVKDGALAVAASGRTPVGTRPNYESTTMSVLQKAMDGTDNADYSLYMGKPIAISACNIYSSGLPVGILVTRTGLDDLGTAPLVQLLCMAVGAAIVLALLTLLLRQMLARVTAPIGEMTEKMAAISAGDLTVWQPKAAHDELDGMGRAMQEMCMSLAIRDYEVDSTLTSYRRFVPMGIDKLMNRASVQEVTTGDVCTITGAVGLLSVANREIARTGLSDEQFVSFVNSCCNTLSRNLEVHNGYLLSSAFDLTASKIFFEGAGKEAVAAAIKLTIREKQTDNVPVPPSFSLIMHHTGLLYGIAGGQDKVFPFTSSAELELLQSYAEQFRQAGIRLVLTENLVQKVDAGGLVRYIGFVSSDDEQFTFKLYELLSVYPDTQCNLRMRYDNRLQEGIQLFYRNDFYLARNIFSALLRTSPDDGIVRWYLFACEYYFNCEEQNNIDYRLFGIDRSNT